MLPVYVVCWWQWRERCLSASFKSNLLLVSRDWYLANPDFTASVCDLPVVWYVSSSSPRLVRRGETVSLKEPDHFYSCPWSESSTMMWKCVQTNQPLEESQRHQLRKREEGSLYSPFFSFSWLRRTGWLSPERDTDVLWFLISWPDLTLPSRVEFHFYRTLHFLEVCCVTVLSVSNCFLIR